MTTATEDMTRMTNRLVEEALATLRAEAERQEIVNRIYNVPQDALEAAKAARERLQAMDDSPEMPSWPLYDATTRVARLCDDAAEAAAWTRLRIQFMSEEA